MSLCSEQKISTAEKIREQILGICEDIDPRLITTAEVSYLVWKLENILGNTNNIVAFSVLFSLLDGVIQKVKEEVGDTSECVDKWKERCLRAVKRSMGEE